MEPVANTSVVEGELRRALGSSRTVQGNSVLLLRAAPEWHGETTVQHRGRGGQVPVIGGAVPDRARRPRRARQPAETTAATWWCSRPARPARSGTPCWLGRCSRRSSRSTGGTWSRTRSARGALTPRSPGSENRWVAEALLDAQPAGGWRRLPAPVLTRATALNRLAATRLGIADADDSAVDAAALLQWTADAPPSRASCGSATKNGRASSTGSRRPSARSRTSSSRWPRPGKIPDAVPFGLAAAALYGASRSAQAAALGHQAGDATMRSSRASARRSATSAATSWTSAALRAFGEAAESLVIRWADNGHAPQAAALCERAEAILAELRRHRGRQAQALASRSRVLEAGLDARLAAFADALSDALSAHCRAATSAEPARGSPRPRKRSPRSASTAGSGTGTPRSAPPPAAVRLARWLATPEEPAATLADAATRMLRSWAWADRALASIARADTGRVPSARPGLRDPVGAGQGPPRPAGRRVRPQARGLDGGILRVRRPAARGEPARPHRPPASRAAAAGHRRARRHDRGGRLRTRRGAHRPRRLAGSRPPRRRPRARPRHRPVGHRHLPDEPADRRAQGRRPGRRSGPASPPSGAGGSPALFHKARPRPRARPVPGQPGPRRDRQTPTPSSASCSTRSMTPWTRASRAGPPTGPRIEVTYLRPVLDEARRAGRPVILTADHGHVLDRETSRSAQPVRHGPAMPPATGRAPRDQARSPCAARACHRHGGERSSPRSTRPSTTRPGRRATTAARPRPRSSSRSSPCSRPTSCSRPAGTPTTPPGTPLPGGTPRRRDRAPRPPASRGVRPSWTSRSRRQRRKRRGRRRPTATRSSTSPR